MNQSLSLITGSIAPQTINAAASAYITDSGLLIPLNKLKLRQLFTWRFTITKTAAGLNTSTIFIVRIGTTGSLTDTAVLTFTLPATQTAVIDDALITIEVIVRGPLTSSCVVAGTLTLQHNLASTGFATIPVVILKGVSGIFDATIANLIVGLSCTTPAATVLTIQQVTGREESP